MFVGHLGVAFAARRAAPRAPLALLLAAGGLLDVLWPALLLAGVEHARIAPGDTAFTPLEFTSYPWSHSAAASLVWAGLFAGAVVVLTRDRRTALVSGALVASHWMLDLASHRPDLPLWPGGPRVGLGLWSSVPATLLVEGALFLGGVRVYARATHPRRAAGRWALAALVLLLAAAYLANALGAPPPSVAAVAWANLGGAGITLALAAWADGARSPSAVAGG